MSGEGDWPPKVNAGHGGTVISAEDFRGTPADLDVVGEDVVHILLVKLHPDGIEQVRQVVREEIAKALKETFQR